MNPALQTLQSRGLSLAGTPSQNTQGQAYIQPPPMDAIANAQQNGNGLINFLLPTAGAVLGDLTPLGPLGAGAGASGGQALADLLTGKKPGADVATTGLVTGGLGLLGPILGKLGGKLAGKADELLGVPGQDIFNSVVQKDPWMIQNTGKLAKTAQEMGYLDQPVLNSLSKMPQDFQNINSDITAAIESNNTPIPLVNGVDNKPSLFDNFNSQLEKSSYGPGDPQFESAQQGILNRMNNLGENGISDAQSVYGEKARMSDILSNTFDRQARGSTLTPKEEANLAYFHALKDTLGDYGSPEVQALNAKQHDMYDIAKAFGQRYVKQAAKQGGSLSMKDIIPAGLGEAAGFFMGGHPLVGAALGLGVDKVVTNPTVLGGLGNILKTGAEGLSTPLGGAATAIGGVSGAQALSSMLGVGQGGPGHNQTDQNQSDNLQNNSLPFLDSGNSNNLGQTITQNGLNVNQQSASPDQVVNDLTTPLPAPSQLSNQIPGQPFPIDKQQEVLSRIQSDMQRASGNPLAMEAVGQEMTIYNSMKSMNDQIVNNYIQQQGLSGDQQDFVRTAPVLDQNMIDLKNLIKKEGNTNTFQALVNDNPTIQYLKANQDPTGDYARMLSLLRQIGASGAKAAVGGRLSNFDAQTYNSLAAGDTKAVNLANLDQLQKNLRRQYIQYAPLYGLSLQGGQSAPQQPPAMTGSSQLDGILQAAQQ